MVVEPPQKNLLRGESEKLLQRLILLQQSVELGVELDVNLAQKTPADDLPDKAKN